MLEQRSASGEVLAERILSLVANQSAHAEMSRALERWHHANAAELIAERMIALMEAMHGKRWKRAEVPNESGFRVLQLAVRNP